MNYLILMAAFCVIGIGCTPKTKSSTPGAKTYTTKTGKIINILEEHPVGMSLSTVKIGFDKDSLAPFVLTDIDPVNKIIMGDLDSNGFDEVYIISTAAGSGSYGSIHGFASNNDKSLSAISIPGVEKGDLAQGGLFEGYEGHDEFFLDGHTLTRTFPVTLAEGNKRTISYKLKKGEAAFQLFIDSSTIK